MREITSHKVNGLNNGLKLTATDEPGQGGANHSYEVEYADGRWGPDVNSTKQTVGVHFQKGPLLETGPNGITNEVLLAIVEDRLKGFQSSQFACRENAIALTKIQEAMHWLHHRTSDRIARGVEGTNTK